MSQLPLEIVKFGLSPKAVSHYSVFVILPNSLGLIESFIFCVLGNVESSPSTLSSVPSGKITIFLRHTLTSLFDEILRVQHDNVTITLSACYASKLYCRLASRGATSHLVTSI